MKHLNRYVLAVENRHHVWEVYNVAVCFEPSHYAELLRYIGDRRLRATTYRAFECAQSALVDLLESCC
jgi:hypothetical protein